MRHDRLIVTADDFGLALEVNEAVEIAHRAGLLSAASLMVSGPAAADAVRRAQRMPGLRIGLHLALVEARPCLPSSRIPLLVDARGELRRDMTRLALVLVARRAAARELAAEIMAQFEAFRATGLALDHVNAHKHFHLHPLVSAQVLAIGRRFGMGRLRIPQEPTAVLGKIEGERSHSFLSNAQPWVRLLRARANRTGVASPDWVFGLRWSGAMTPSRLSGLLAHLPPGVVEIYLHPATADTFPGHAPGYRYSEELAALCDPACLEALRRSGRRPEGYSDALAG